MEDVIRLIHVENVNTKKVHYGWLKQDYRPILNCYFVALCGGRSDSEYAPIDQDVDCGRCIKIFERRNLTTGVING